MSSGKDYSHESAEQTHLLQVARDYAMQLDRLVGGMHRMQPLEVAMQLQNMKLASEVWFCAHWMLVRGCNLDAQAIAHGDSLGFYRDDPGEVKSDA